MFKKYDPFIGYDAIITFWLQAFFGILLNLLIITIFIPTWLYSPLVPVEMITNMSRANFMVLSLAGFGVLLSGYFSFIFYIIGPYILVKILIKKFKKETEK